MDTELHVVPNTPPSVYLLKDWCTEAEESYLLNRVYNSGSSVQKKWTTVSGRRLQNFGGTVHEKGMLLTKIPDWLVTTIEKVQTSVGPLLTEPINHVLVNEYEPGNGILPHQDGGLYAPSVAIVSLACDAVMRFTPHKSFVEESNSDEGNDELSSSISDNYPFDVFLPRRSLLLFKERLYDGYLHGIDFSEADVIDASVVNAGDAGVAAEKVKNQNDDDDSDNRPVVRRTTTRVSMTFRNVRNVRKALRLF